MNTHSLLPPILYKKNSEHTTYFDIILSPEDTPVPVTDTICALQTVTVIGPGVQSNLPPEYGLNNANGLNRNTTVAYK